MTSEQPKFSEQENRALSVMKRDPAIKYRLFMELGPYHALVGLTEGYKAIKGFFFFHDDIRPASASELDEFSLLMSRPKAN